ncbi:hypothetical protein [Nocardia colli]|uniref:hypothetical protein n=1 Tax=Nocardia colli TaxID=2545717 RepID=UPI0035D8A879
MIARLDPDCAVADLFSSEIYYDTTEPEPGQRSIHGWSDSVRTAPGSPVSLDALDYALDARGYVRTTGWHAHITAAEVLRYFAAATIEIDETVT